MHTYHDEDKHQEHRPNQRSDPGSITLQHASTNHAFNSQREHDGDSDEKHDEEQLNSDPDHVQSLSRFHRISAVLVGDHASSSGLDEK